MDNSALEPQAADSACAARDAGVAGDDAAALLADLDALQRRAAELADAVQAERENTERLPWLADRIMPLGLKDVAPRDVPREALRRQHVRLERESRHLRELGAELLDLCRDARARGGAGRERSDSVLQRAKWALAMSHAVVEYAQRVATPTHRRRLQGDLS